MTNSSGQTESGAGGGLGCGGGDAIGGGSGGDRGVRYVDTHN